MDPNNPLWPQYDLQIMTKYGGNWVVVVDGRIVASGEDPEALCERAAKDHHLPIEAVYAVAICRPEELRL
jgi:uncharacterized protein (DUF427 family)